MRVFKIVLLFINGTRNLFVHTKLITDNIILITIIIFQWELYD